MPSIIIREHDNTNASSASYSSFAVAMPGKVFVIPESGKETGFDENGICEVNSINKFESYIGYASNEPEGKIKLLNQIAYDLISIGYTVYIKRIDDLVDLDKESFWEAIKDKSLYDIRYITTGTFISYKATQNILDVVNFINLDFKSGKHETNGRGDCIALVDLDEDELMKIGKSKQEIVKKIIAQLNDKECLNGTLNKYSAVFTPRVNYAEDVLPSSQAKDDSGNKVFKNTLFPASFHYLACATKAFDTNKEWFAVAGFDRGVSDFDIANTEIKYGEVIVNALGPRAITDELKNAVNVITNIRGNYYIWGNRTAYRLDNEGLVASHFLNIRQLCTTLKKELYVTCKKFTFDPNSDVLWINFVNAIKPTLETMKANQGIKDYRVIRCVSGNKAVLAAKIRIVPIEAVEDFYIDLFLEDSIEGIAVGVSEEE